MKPIPQRKNANRHTQRGMGLLEGSIEKDGWIGAVTVAADGETFDGSARVEVTARMGMLDDPIVVHSDGTRPVIVVRDDIPSADDERAVRLGLGANWIAAKNLDWDPGVLAELAGTMDLSALFFPNELATLSQPSGEPVDVNELWKGMPEFEQEDLEAYKKTVVHFLNEDDYQAFFKLIGQPPNAKAIWYPYQANVPIGIEIDES